MRILATIAWMLVSVALGAQSSTQMGYNYTLASDMSNVTIGVKDASGALIRTLTPRGQPQNAGSYSGIWDGKTDAGAAATGGPFTIAVLYGNPTYTFDGMIGNTSNSWFGWSNWARGQIYFAQSKITFIGGTGWSTQGGSEGTNGLMYFADSNPNSPMIVSPSYVGTFINFTDIDNDGQYLYMTSAAYWAGAASFVTKFDGFTGRPVLFTQGQTTIGPAPIVGGAILFAYPGTTMSAIDINLTSYDHVPTAIAVQTGGNILAIGHGNWRTIATHNDGALNTNNVIKFFDKTTGAAIGTNATLANPTSMAFNSAGNLWVIGNGALNLITGPSTTNTITQPISGLSFPVAVAVNKTNSHIIVADGGTSQQVKEFDASYTLVRSYGVAGGYNDCNPTVAPNRLMLDYTAVTGVTQIDTQPVASVRVEPNGDVWVFDSLNGGESAGSLAGSSAGRQGRLQHITPNGAGFTLLNQVQFSALQGYMGVSHTQPTRVFEQMLEYAFDYTKPNNPGDPTAPGGSGSWQLVRDWAVGAGGACGSSGATFFPLNHYTHIVAAEQLSNGRVYAEINNGWATGLNQLQIAELPASGTTPLRLIGNPLGTTPIYMMGRDGSFNYFVNTGSGASSVITEYKIPLTGFNGSNNPTYGVAAIQVAVTYNSATQPVGSPTVTGTYENNNEATTGGVYPVVQWTQNNSSATTGFPHLGGMLTGRSSYVFTVLPELCSSFLANGAFNGSFPCAAQSNPGAGIHTEGRHIILPWGTNSSQYQPGNWHYWEDGILIGQFGPYFTNSYTPTGPNSIPGSSFPQFFNPYNTAVGFQGAQVTLAPYTENALSTRVLMVNGDLYLFIQSEGWTVPVSIWKISNLASLHEYAGTGSLGQSVSLSTLVF